MSMKLEGSEYPHLNLAPYEEITGLLKSYEVGEEYLYIEFPPERFKIELGSYEFVTELDDLDEGEYTILSILRTPDSERPFRMRAESTAYIEDSLRDGRLT